MMFNQELDDRLRDVSAAVLGVDPEYLTETASPDNLGEWSSLRHLSLIAAVEEEFAIRFTLEEISKSQQFGELRRIVAGHLDLRLRHG